MYDRWVKMVLVEQNSVLMKNLFGEVTLIQHLPLLSNCGKLEKDRATIQITTKDACWMKV